MNNDLKDELEELTNGDGFARFVLKTLGEKEIVARCKYKSVVLYDTLSDVIDVEDVGEKEKEEKYKNLDTILDDFINVINKQFKEEKDG